MPGSPLHVFDPSLVALSGEWDETVQAGVQAGLARKDYFSPAAYALSPNRAVAVTVEAGR